METDDWVAPTVAAGVVLAIVGIWLFGGLAFLGIASPMVERIRTETRQQSESYIEGTLSDFEELCLKMNTANDNQKSIYADVIFRRSSRVTDEVLDKMTPEVRFCIQDARTIMTGGTK